MLTLPFSTLIELVEQACVFKAAELETELDARLERLGLVIRPGQIEPYFPGKTCPDQKPCNSGLFDGDALAQSDLSDLI